MTKATTTQEIYPASVSQEQMDKEVKMSISSGAIKSWYEKEDGKWVLYCEWKVG